MRSRAPAGRLLRVYKTRSDSQSLFSQCSSCYRRVKRVLGGRLCWEEESTKLIPVWTQIVLSHLSKMSLTENEFSCCSHVEFEVLQDILNFFLWRKLTSANTRQRKKRLFPSDTTVDVHLNSQSRLCSDLWWHHTQTHTHTHIRELISPTEY